MKNERKKKKERKRIAIPEERKKEGILGVLRF